MTAGCALRTQGLSVRYGGVQALDDVSIEIPEGALVGLIGPNGAGKTTFIDAITGFAPATGGVELAGRSLVRMSPHRRARAGLARTWQSSMLFDELTVLENLSVAASRDPWWRGGLGIRQRGDGRDAQLRTVLGLLDLEPIADAHPDQLTAGQQRLTGVARALAGGPTLLCLDEPAAGLDTGESQVLGKHLSQIVARGTTTLLIDHDMGLVLSICDLIVVLDFGKVIFQGTPDQARRDPAVLNAYLGSSGASAGAPPGEQIASQ